MSEPQFRVTVKDLVTGETRAMEFYPGDYMLIPFEPCHQAHVAAYPANGTHVITLRDHRPQGQHRDVELCGCGQAPVLPGRPVCDRCADQIADEVAAGRRMEAP